MINTALKTTKAKPVFAWIVFAFQPHGDSPSIYSPDPCVALTERDAQRAVRNLAKQGIHAWYMKRGVYHWGKK